MDFIRTHVSIQSLPFLVFSGRHALEFRKRNTYNASHETRIALRESNTAERSEERKREPSNRTEKKKLTTTTTMTTTIRYNYVFAFIHYYCLTALSASLFFVVQNVHCCTKLFPLWPNACVCARAIASAPVILLALWHSQLHVARCVWYISSI